MSHQTLLEDRLTKADRTNIFINIIAALFVSAIVGLGVWSYKASLTIVVQEQDRKNLEKFVSKEDFHNAQTETSDQLKSLNLKADSMNTDLATLKGMLLAPKK